MDCLVDRLVSGHEWRDLLRGPNQLGSVLEFSTKGVKGDSFPFATLHYHETTLTPATIVVLTVVL